MYFSFKFKIMAAMIIAVSLVSLVSYELIRGQVDSHFEDALQSQYLKQFDLFQKRRSERLSSIANEIITNTANPRLMAALLEQDYSRFYYDLGQELKPFYQNLEFRNDDSRMWPFFRFIDAQGRYLSPPTVADVGVENAVDTLPGIMAPIAEGALQTLLSRLRTNEVEPLDVRSGYLVSPAGDAAQPAALMEAYVCPIVDAFGMFLGDLIVIIPWQPDPGMQVNTVSTMIVGGQVFGSDSRDSEADVWAELLQAVAAGNETNTDNQPPVLRMDDVPHVLFFKQLVFDARFPVATQATLFSLEEQYALQQNIANILILIVAGGLSFSLLLSLAVAQGLNTPIARLIHAVNRVGQGDFSARVHTESQDEIGELSQAFNHMTEELSLKERYKNVLSQVTDSKVADRLMRGEVELGGEELEVTILFCDVRGFTDMSAGMDPHRLVSFLNKHMTAMTEVAYQYGGVVDKFVGDEIMVLFGAPIPGENDRLSAFECACEMIRRRQEMNETAEVPLDIGIGLAHGTVVAGCMGSKDRLNYTVIGECVNLASRLCGQARQMQIAVDGGIRQSLGSRMNAAKEEVKTLKGFEGFTSFYVVGETDIGSTQA